MTISKRIISHIIVGLFLQSALFSLSSLGLQNESQNYSRQEAERVMRLIEKIHREQSEGETGGLKKVAVTESELNSYIAYRIEAEQSDIMKELRLKIFEKNKIEGKVYVDLRGQDLPKILRPEMNFYFGGTLEVREGLVRLNLESLFLESQKIQPELLNMVIYIGSKSQGTEPFRLDDWFELPYGIQDFETAKGRATFYY
jgi:hypothetical protein